MIPQDRRNAIIEATLPLLLARGPELRTREIATASGVSEGTIFRVFDTKDELIEAVIEAAMRPTATLNALAALGPQSLTERTVAVLGILSAELQRGRTLFAHLASAGVKPHSPHGFRSPDATDPRAQVLAATATAFDPYASELSVPTTTVARLLTALAFASIFSLAPTDPIPDPEALARLALHGIAKGE